MKRNNLYINKDLLDSFAENRYKEIAGTDEGWENIKNTLKDVIDPKCSYIIFNKDQEFKTENNSVIIENQIFTWDTFKNMPQEIIGDIALYVLTVGNTNDIFSKTESILSEALVDIALTAYVDAMRNLLRMELQEDHIVSGSVAPGLDGMPLEDIAKFDKILDFSSLGISINDHFVMIPEKSTAGMFVFFKEEHPVNINSCETCMARGRGCDFCTAGKDS